jgi:malate/lactate dehydrogenase
MERSDLLKANAAIFKVQGKALSDYSSKNVKVNPLTSPLPFPFSRSLSFPSITSFMFSTFVHTSRFPLTKKNSIISLSMYLHYMVGRSGWKPSQHQCFAGTNVSYKHSQRELLSVNPA